MKEEKWKKEKNIKWEKGKKKRGKILLCEERGFKKKDMLGKRIEERKNMKRNKIEVKIEVNEEKEGMKENG